MSYRPRVSEALLAGGGELSMSRQSVSTNALTATSGAILLCPFYASRSEPITKGRVRVGATAAAAVTLIKIGIYQIDLSGNMTLLASTANTTGMCGTPNVAGTLTALTATWSKVAGRLYAAAFVFVGTTAPTIWGGYAAYTSNTPANPFDLKPFDGGALRRTGQTDLTAAIPASSLTVVSGTQAPLVEFLP